MSQTTDAQEDIVADTEVRHRRNEGTGAQETTVAVVLDGERTLFKGEPSGPYHYQGDGDVPEEVVEAIESTPYKVAEGGTLVPVTESEA
ncbi:hypothetical protein ACFQJC_14555 [Haloferax namakaokahaiae]|uniref:Uncharacterized protein n=1 Tax=Haloferax namakaokahaiae TaxID=1748331 RepID=A0ABD5ZHJ4_9EURY